MSYDDLQLVNEIKIWLKGHQIIGELRLLLKTQILHLLRIEGSPDHWWVTTAFKDSDTTFAKDWRVTRSLVSYDTYFCVFWSHLFIEGSPDHWWVTTLLPSFCSCHPSIEGSPDHWWVTTTGDRKWTVWLKYWRVTRSLVSYDYIKELNKWSFRIEGSPDHWCVTTCRSV